MNEYGIAAFLIAVIILLVWVVFAQLDNLFLRDGRLAKEELLAAYANYRGCLVQKLALLKNIKAEHSHYTDKEREFIELLIPSSTNYYSLTLGVTSISPMTATLKFSERLQLIVEEIKKSDSLIDEARARYNSCVSDYNKILAGSTWRMIPSSLTRHFERAHYADDDNAVLSDTFDLFCLPKRENFKQ